MTTWVKARAILNWLNGSTLAGLLVAKLGGAKLTRGPDRLWLAEGYRLSFPVAGAFTIGNVLLTASAFATREERIPGTLAHEARHSSQYACLGVFFLPVYIVAMGWSWLRTGDRAARHFLERMANLKDGGYKDVPVRPLKSLFTR
ncbi:MAG: hypothetical protein LBN10_00625 [Propionibacteriaceae bacterium]|jgi:hypothetical protein|nr:hypothetical protein [Propionibacteriaceae bacterium]